jgi:hypothetical protein
MKTLLLLIIILLNIAVSKANNSDSLLIENEISDPAFMEQQKKKLSRLNFFVFTMEKSKKTDWIAIYTLIRARMKSFFHQKQFKVIRAHSAENAAMQIENILKKKNKMIKNIWFDSHGHYGNRFSSFRVGSDQVSYKNLSDTNIIKSLEKIAGYCDEETKVGIGSCYAGADFYFPATDSTPASRMNGDSLMIGLGNIFKRSSIYASESWVMSKPGIFKNKYGFAGYPINRRFKDSVYAPVWKRLGKWREYSFVTRTISSIPTVALDKKCNIRVRTKKYNEFTKAKRRIEIALKNLKPGLASFN